MAKSFPQYVYGKDNEYVRGYEAETYYTKSPLFRNLTDARKFAITYGIKHQSQDVDSWGKVVGVRYEDHISIREIVYVRVGRDLQQSGKTRCAGWTIYESDAGKWIWRDRVKSKSVWMDKNGKGIKKLTRSEIERYLW